MPYELRMLIEARVIQVVLQTEVDLVTMQHLQQEITQALEQGSAPVHLIVDVSRLTKPPTNIRELSQINTYLRHPKLGWVIMVQPTALSRFVLAIVGGIAGVRHKTAQSLAEAVTVLRHVDTTLAI